ncbi:hypothetical protein [Ramlibacter rhizophilus]|uniref:hypothetical protein n=1 Tax=Ramlibacter rhizophilus TaxID=1781167 RepID=UPI0014327122|nr:hypothetical protein [Ramlibacter rhizophilus]
MIPYQLDPSLHAAPPQPTDLGDGFAPPPQPASPQPASVEEQARTTTGLAGDPSPF